MSDAPSAEEEEAPAGAWIHWFTIGSIALGLAALGLTIWSVGWHHLIDELRAVGWWFAAIIGLEGVITCLDAAALSGFLGKGGRRPSYLYVLEAQVAGRAINVITPGGSLGEATKVTKLMATTSSSRAVGAVVRYNVASIGVTLGLIAAGAPICAIALDLPDWMERMLVVGGGIAAVIVVVGAFLVHRGLLASGVDLMVGAHLITPKRRAAWKSRLTRIDRHVRGHGSLLERWWPAGIVAVSRALSSLSTWMTLAVIDHVAGVGTMAALATAGPLISTVAAIVPLGLGVTEGAYAALFGALGEQPTLGVTITLARRVTQVIYAAIGLVILAGSTTFAHTRRRHPKK